MSLCICTYFLYLFNSKGAPRLIPYTSDNELVKNMSMGESVMYANFNSLGYGSSMFSVLSKGHITSMCLY